MITCKRYMSYFIQSYRLFHLFHAVIDPSSCSLEGEGEGGYVMFYCSFLYLFGNCSKIYNL